MQIKSEIALDLIKHLKNPSCLGSVCYHLNLEILILAVAFSNDWHIDWNCSGRENATVPHSKLPVPSPHTACNMRLYLASPLIYSSFITAVKLPQS